MNHALAHIPVTTKRCGNSKCTEANPQPLKNFGRNKSRVDGLAHYCKICQHAANRKYQSENLEKSAAKARRLRAELKAKDPQKAWAIRRNQRLKAEYGMTLEQYNQMFVEQAGCCAICNRPSVEFPKGLVVDHCHTTGNVRKLLCGLCNQLLGSAKENIKVLESAIAYIAEFSP